MKKLKVIAALSLAITTVACVAAPRFEYGAYEPTLYSYFKKPELRDRYETALESAIQKGEQTERLAPGLYAELGYLRLQDGDTVAAVKLFEIEKAAFPEAKYFMDRIIARATGETVSESSAEAKNDAAKAGDEILIDSAESLEQVGE